MFPLYLSKSGNVPNLCNLAGTNSGQMNGRTEKILREKPRNENNNKQKGVKKFAYACAAVVVFLSFFIPFISSAVYKTQIDSIRLKMHTQQHNGRIEPNLFVSVSLSLSVCFAHFLSVAWSPCFSISGKLKAQQHTAPSLARSLQLCLCQTNCGNKFSGKQYETPSANWTILS